MWEGIDGKHILSRFSQIKLIEKVMKAEIQIDSRENTLHGRENNASHNNNTESK